MTEPIKVATFRGYDILYDTERKQFVAGQMGSLEHPQFRGASQREVERAILKSVSPELRIKALLTVGCFSGPTVETVEVVGRRHGSLQYKSGTDGRVRSEGYRGQFKVWTERLERDVKALLAEHEAWTKKWEKLMDSAKDAEEAEREAAEKKP